MPRAADRLIIVAAVGVLAGSLVLSAAAGTGTELSFGPVHGSAGTGTLLGMAAAVLLGYGVCAYPRTVLPAIAIALGGTVAAWRLRPDRLAPLVAAVSAVAVIAFALSLAISIMFFAAILRRGDVLWLVAAGCAAFTIQWLFYVDAAYRYLAIYLVAGLSLSAYLAVRRQAGRGPRAFFYGLCTVLAVTGLSQVLPHNFQPLSFDALSRRLVQAFPFLQDLRGPAGYGTGLRFQFSLARTGYGTNPDDLGGPVRMDQTPVLRVRVRGDAVPPTLYLRGVARDSYTGRGWYSRGSRYIEYTAGTDLDAGYAPAIPTDDMVQEYAILDGPLTTLFAVLEPETARLAGGPFLADQNGNLLSPRALNRGAVYSVLSRVPRFNSRQIRKLGAAPDTGDMDAYLRLPPRLPARVVDLARQVAGSGHPYDQARAIETYLRSIPYSLEPPATPPGRDFVDFFLFDLRRGYCSYYSSAMAVMLRAVGIPSRLVEGYAVNLAPGRETADITNANAHAWAEAYFPGYGWVPFEPTPSFWPADHSRPLPEAGAPGGANAGHGGPVLDLPSRRDLLDDSDLELPGGKARPPGWKGLLPYLFLAAAIAALEARAIWSAAGIRRREWVPASVADADPVGAVCRAHAGLISLLGDFGLSPAPAQTPAQYAAVLAERFPTEGHRLLELARVYGEARYGRGEIDPAAARAAVKAALELRSALARLLVQELGPIRFWWLRLIVARGARGYLKSSRRR